MDYIPYAAAAAIGAASVDIYKNNKNKKSQIDNNFNFSDFELEFQTQIGFPLDPFWTPFPKFVKYGLSAFSGKN